MLKFLLFPIWLFSLTASAQEIDRIDHYLIGTRVTYFMGQCAGKVPEAEGKLSFCDGAGNLGVVMESLGLSDRGVLRTLPNYYNNSEVYVTRRGVSIRHADGSWENVPNIAIPTTDFQDRLNNNGMVDLGFVDAGGVLHLVAQNVGIARIYVNYNLLTKEIVRVPVEDLQSANLLAYDVAEDATYLVTSSGGNETLYRRNGLGPVELLSTLDGLDSKLNASNSSAKLKVNGGTLWWSFTGGLYAFDLSGSTEPEATLYDASTTGRLPLNTVNDFEFADDGALWLAQAAGNDGALVRYDLEADTYQEFVLTDDLNPLVERKFQDLALLDDGRVTAVASNYFGIIDLDWRGEEPVWAVLDRDSLEALGIAPTFTPAEVQRFNGSIYYAANDLSTGNTGKPEVLIRTGERWTVRNDNAPGNYSHWALDRFQHFQPDDRGGMYFYSDYDDVITYIDEDDGLRSKQYGNLVGQSPAVDDAGRLAYLSTDQRQWKLLDWPDDLPINGLTSSSEQVAAYGNVLAFFNPNTGVYTRTINRIIVARDTLDPSLSYAGYFQFAVSDGGNAWSARNDRSGGGTLAFRYDVADKTTEEFKIAADIGQIDQLLAGPDGGMYLIGRSGVIYYDGAEFHSLLGSDNPALRTIHSGVVDEANRLWLLTDFGGTVRRVENLAGTPTVTTFRVEELLPFTNLVGSTVIGLDADGDLWIEGQNSLFKLVDDLIEPSYRPAGEAFTLSGTVYLDGNDNRRVDAGEGVDNQAVVLTVGEHSVATLTGEGGRYSFLLDERDTDYRLTLPTVDRLMLADERQGTVAVTETDRTYPGPNFRLTYKGYHSLYFQTANKSGAYGFQREGFSNTFTTAVTNLSDSEPFRELDIELLYFNKSPGGSDLPAVRGVKVTRLSPIGLPILVDRIVISPRNHQWELRGVPPDQYRSEAVDVAETIRASADTVAVSLSFDRIDPRQTLIVEVEFEVFDAAGNGATFVYTPGRAESPDFSDGGAPGGGVILLYPYQSSDGGGGGDAFYDPNSPYISPDDIYDDPPYIAPEDIYSPPPYRVPILSSYDPNEKLVDGGLAKAVNDTEVDQKWLSYTIHFENLGNFSAKDIWVLDTLDTQLQPGSFMLLDASHDVAVDFRETSDSLTVLRFSFENIFLAFQDSINDGYVRFALRASEAIAAGDVISNQAAIYFDQNPAIITNVVRNRFIEISTPVSNPATPEVELSVFPNPATERLNIRSPHAILGAQLLDAQGRILADFGPTNTLSFSRVPAGIYLLRIRTDAGSALRRVLLR